MTEDPPPFGCFRAIAVVLVVVVATVLGAPDASAHRPWFNDIGSPDPEAPYALAELDVSQVIYGALERPGHVDYYSLDVPAGFVVDVQIVVPDVPACARFRPALVVHGPDGTPAEFVIPAKGTPISGGDGRPDVRVLDADEWGTFFEPFTGTTYATGPRWSEAVKPGKYLLAVFDQEGETGTYGLSLGGVERPGGDVDFAAKIEPYELCEPPRTLDPATPTP